MRFTILRLLTHSELGMFHEYRRRGLEGSRQRAINFDSDVVDRVFPSAKDSDSIAISCRCLVDEKTVVVKNQRLRKQAKNWRLEGHCPRSRYYGFVKPNVLFAMVVDSSNIPATASWVVVPIDHPARTAIIHNGETARLNRSAMIALHGEEGDYSRSVLGQYFPQLFEKVEDEMNTAGPVNDNGETPPDPLGLFNILARAGHSLPSAVADLVDNSLSKDATKIDITFPNPNQGGRWMCIRDDGVGMTPDGLRDAMTIGHQRDYDPSDLGKFGYGLKGAAWSQGDCLTVVSKAVGSKASVQTWDKGHLARTRRWELLSNPVDEKYVDYVKLGTSGTAVLLTEMRPPLDPPKARGVEPYALELASIREHLELVFHRFLEGKVPGRKKVSICLNDEKLQPNNPMGHPLTKTYDPRSIELPGHDDTSERATVKVVSYITPNDEEFREHHKNQTPEQQKAARERLTLNGRANDSQGFYFYRLDRLIKWGGWENLFVKDEHTKLIRVAVDFDRLADEQLQVDISKQLIRLPVAVADSLKEIIKSPRSEARRRYGKKAKPKNKRTPKPGGTSKPISGGDKKGNSGNGGSPTSGATEKKRIPLRLVEGVTIPWERKTSFTGELVEVSEQIPELVSLVQAIDKDDDAKTALSEFLRVLERADVVRLLVGKADGK